MHQNSLASWGKKIHNGPLVSFRQIGGPTTHDLTQLIAEDREREREGGRPKKENENDEEIDDEEDDGSDEADMRGALRECSVAQVFHYDPCE